MLLHRFHWMHDCLWNVVILMNRAHDAHHTESYGNVLVTRLSILLCKSSSIYSSKFFENKLAHRIDFWCVFRWNGLNEYRWNQETSSESFKLKSNHTRSKCANQRTAEQQHIRSVLTVKCRWKCDRAEERRSNECGFHIVGFFFTVGRRYVHDSNTTTRKKPQEFLNEGDRINCSDSNRKSTRNDVVVIQWSRLWIKYSL